MIINLTQHSSTPEQQAVGVVDLPQKKIAELLTFTSLPLCCEVRDRAETIADLAEFYGASSAMIGGASYLMAPLEQALLARGIMPVYAFTVREVRETVLLDGTVTKTSIFRHAGWVSAVESF